MATEIRNPVLRFVVYGHVLLAIGAAAQVWWTSELLGAGAPPMLLAFVALAAFSAYGIMRLFRMNTPALAGSALLIWYRANWKWMLALLAGTSLLSALVGWPYRADLLHALWVPAIIAAFYILPTWITGGRAMGLRQVPLLKALLIAFVWTSVVVALPGSVDQGLGIERWSVFFLWFCYFLAIAIVFDIRDLPYDPPFLRTIPQLFGVRAAKWMALLLLLPMAFFLLMMSLGSDGTGGAVSWEFVLPLFGLVLLGGSIILARAERPWWYYGLLVDGMVPLLPALAWLGGSL